MAAATAGGEAQCTECDAGAAQCFYCHAPCGGEGARGGQEGVACGGCGRGVHAACEGAHQLAFCTATPYQRIFPSSMIRTFDGMCAHCRTPHADDPCVACDGCGVYVHRRTCLPPGRLAGGEGAEEEGGAGASFTCDLCTATRDFAAYADSAALRECALCTRPLKAAAASQPPRLLVERVCYGREWVLTKDAGAPAAPSSLGTFLRRRPDGTASLPAHLVLSDEEQGGGGGRPTYPTPLRVAAAPSSDAGTWVALPTLVHTCCAAVLGMRAPLFFANDVGAAPSTWGALRAHWAAADKAEAAGEAAAAGERSCFLCCGTRGALWACEKPQHCGCKGRYPMHPSCAAAEPMQLKVARGAGKQAYELHCVKRYHRNDLVWKRLTPAWPLGETDACVAALRRVEGAAPCRPFVGAPGRLALPATAPNPTRAEVEAAFAGAPLVASFFGAAGAAAALAAHGARDAEWVKEYANEAKKPKEEARARRPPPPPLPAPPPRDGGKGGGASRKRPRVHAAPATGHSDRAALPPPPPPPPLPARPEREVELAWDEEESGDELATTTEPAPAAAAAPRPLPVRPARNVEPPPAEEDEEADEEDDEEEEEGGGEEAEGEEETEGEVEAGEEAEGGEEGEEAEGGEEGEEAEGGGAGGASADAAAQVDAACKAWAWDILHGPPSPEPTQAEIEEAERHMFLLPEGEDELGDEGAEAAGVVTLAEAAQHWELLRPLYLELTQAPWPDPIPTADGGVRYPVPGFEHLADVRFLRGPDE